MTDPLRRELDMVFEFEHVSLDQASATTLATVLHLHGGTPFVYQGQELGMTNAGFSSIGDYRDVESVNHYAQATAAGQEPADVLAALQRMSRDNARPRCSGTTRRTPDSAPASRGSP